MKCDGGISRLIRDALLVAVACVAFIACVVTVGLNYSNLLFDEKCYEAPCAPEKRLKSVHLVLMLTGIPSLIASVLVVVSYLCKRGWRRHPASLLVSRAIADGVWSAQLIGGTLYELTTGYLPNCAVVSPIVQFSLFASELYLAMLCVDLLLSSNDPFTSFVSNRRRFHAIVIFGASVATIGITVMPNFWSAAEDAQHGCPIYGPSHLTAMCWIRSGGRKHANDANPATWIPQTYLSCVRVVRNRDQLPCWAKRDALVSHFEPIDEEGNGLRRCVPSRDNMMPLAVQASTQEEPGAVPNYIYIYQK